MSTDELSVAPVELIVADTNAGDRLDAFLARNFPHFSRAHLCRVIQAGGVRVDGQRTKAAFRLRAGQHVTLTLPEIPCDVPQPENIPLEILFEDEALIAINKPANMVVHPSKGHWSGTLTAALAYHFSQLSTAAGPTRPGIVHRLDRETSGVLVVAKNDQVHLNLAAQFEARTTQKEYLALVVGSPDHDRDWIDQPIGVHPYQREKMAIRKDHPKSRAANTFYEVVERFRGFAAVRVKPKTGRTHQIRVHLAHIGHPVLCDRLYGGRRRVTHREIAGAGEDAVLLERQALHARRLRVTHPTTGKSVEFEAPLPDDIQNVLTLLRTANQGGPRTQPK